MAGGWMAASASAAEGDARYAPKPASQTPPSEQTMSQWLKRLGKVRLPGEYERSHTTVTGAFRDVAAGSSRSTVRVLSDGTQTALGVVVHADGLVLTKASELAGKLECIFADGRRLPADKVAQRDQFDLALLQVARTGLPVVQWSDATVPQVGSWLVTTNLDASPVAIGVVSAPPQASPTPRAILGVRMFTVERGVRVNHVMPGTGAARAGVREGDVIATINGQAVQSPETISKLIQALQPGDQVTLSVIREQSPLSLVATLGDVTRLGGLDQAELMDSLGGPLSKRRAGFPSVIQHDSILQPRECGGPLVGLDGKAVGVNIARVSRVASYALPAELARNAVQEMVRELPGLTPQREPTTLITTAKPQSTSP